VQDATVQIDEPRELAGSPGLEGAALGNIFPGDSEMAQRMRELDWSKTPLGPASEWPQSLRTSVSTCLNCAFPIVLWLGSELTLLYNDEYKPILGPKHPAALGQPGAQVWAEVWDVIGPMLSQVMTRDEATRSRDMLLHIDRGSPEEAYFSFSYSPIRAESGKVGGVFCPVIETTQKVIGERRLRTLRDLAAECQGATSELEEYRIAAKVLAANPYDVPFALLYRIDVDHSAALLAATASIETGTPASPLSVPIQSGNPSAGSLSAVVQSGKTALLTDPSSPFGSNSPTGAWKPAARSVLAIPILLPGQERPRAILVAATSPMCTLDVDYRTFFELIGTQIASGLADAQALETERSNVAALAALDRAKTTFFSNVSHEFRTPLTLLLGPLQDAAERPAEGLRGEALSSAHRNALRLLKLVNTLLDFSRIQADRAIASYAPLDLRAATE
jgi:His Kinase A (phospho-acceptor) domain/PAS fold